MIGTPPAVVYAQGW